MPTTTHDAGLTSIDHLTIYVRNRPKAVTFFARQLGLVILTEAPDRTMLLCGDQVLGLHDAPKGNRNDGIHHIGFRVAEWTGLKNRLRRARLHFSEERELPDGKSISVQGPERLRVELFYRTSPAEAPRPARRTPETAELWPA